MIVPTASRFRRAAVSTLIAPLSLTTFPPAASATEESGPITCKRTGHLRLTPGLTFTPQRIQMNERGAFPSCSGLGADDLTAVLDATPVVDGSCAHAEATAPRFTIKWSDGTSSTGNATASTSPFPPLVEGTGQLVAGKFTGRSFHFRLVLAPENPQQCLTSGVTDVDYAGEIVFD